MGELTDVVIPESVDDLRGQVEDQDQDECQGDLAVSDVCEGGKEDHHEDDAASPQEAAGEDEHIQHPRHQGGDQDHQEEAEGSVFFLQDGAQQEDEGQIPHEMAPVDVAHHMGEEGYVVGGVGCVESVSPGNHEEGRDQVDLEELRQKQQQRGYQGIGQGDRGVVAYFDIHGIRIKALTFPVKASFFHRSNGINKIFMVGFFR